MKIQIIFIFSVLAVVISCSDNNNSMAVPVKLTSKDATVGKKVIQQNHGKVREAVYFSIRNGDTLNLQYHFLQNSMDSVEIVVYERAPLQYPDLSYREELQEQKLVLDSASKDFQLESLSKIWDIPLLATGDLAITITKELPTEYLNKPLHNLDVAKVLLASKLTTDLNELLKPYGKKIKKYVVEKAQFLDNSIILKHNKIETPKPEIPSKILDAQIWTVIENSGG